MGNPIIEHNPVMASLRSGLPTNMSVLSDSTANETDEWVYKLISRLASMFTNYHVEYHLWDDDQQAYNSGGVIFNSDNEQYIDFSGVRGASAEDTDIPNITGDLDVRIKLRADDYTPGAEQGLFGQYRNTAGTCSFYISLMPGGTIRYSWSDDAGTNKYSATSTAAISANITGLADGVTKVWVKVTHDIDNGSSDSDIKFYTSEDGITWTQLGDTVQHGSTTSISAISEQWYIGSRNTTYLPFAGRIYKVQVADSSVGLDLTAGDYGYPWINNQNMEDLWTPDGDDYVGGGPEFKIFNGSTGGAAIATWDDADRRPRAFPSACYSLNMAMVSLGHNEGIDYNATKMAEYVTLAENLNTLEPLAEIVFMTQNPRIDPAIRITIQAYRMRRLGPYVRRNGYRTIDVFRAFERLGTWDTKNYDGIHPDDAAQDTWANAVYDWLHYERPVGGQCVSGVGCGL